MVVVVVVMRGNTYFKDCKEGNRLLAVKKR